MLHDAHLHIGCDDLIQEMKRYDIEAIANAASLEEYCYLKGLRKEWPKLHISAGIHPWNVENTQWAKMQPVLEEASIIGEIGLDNVWCECAFEKQKVFFERQLAYACKTHKPVILHLKGMEKEALDYLKRYPNIYLVHWYSCKEYLEDYIALDCYFTIGPSVGLDEAVDWAALKVPFERLLIETDGLDAVAWADGEPKESSDYAAVLERSIERIAMIRKVDPQTLRIKLQENFRRFLAYAYD